MWEKVQTTMDLPCNSLAMSSAGRSASLNFQLAEEGAWRQPVLGSVGLVKLPKRIRVPKAEHQQHGKGCLLGNSKTATVSDLQLLTHGEEFLLLFAPNTVEIMTSDDEEKGSL